MSVQGMVPIQPLWTVSEAEGVQSREGVGGPAVPFADVFQSMVENVRETDAARNETAYLLATGQLDNPAEYTIAANQALYSAQLLTELRNKALDAYSEIMRISI